MDDFFYVWWMCGVQDVDNVAVLWMCGGLNVYDVDALWI